MAQKIIGIAGRMASGKGTISKYIIAHAHATRHGSSGPLRQVLDLFMTPQTRHNLRILSTFMRREYGEDIIARTMRKTTTESKADVAIFDGMRRLIDVETFRTLPNFSFIFVDVDEKIRYERYISRNENPGDAEMTFEQFQEADMAEPEGQIEFLKSSANYVIDNNGDYEHFEQQIIRIVSTILSD